MGLILALVRFLLLMIPLRPPLLASCALFPSQLHFGSEFKSLCRWTLIFWGAEVGSGNGLGGLCLSRNPLNPALKESEAGHNSIPFSMMIHEVTSE